ncbi:hypothetical protein QVD17_37385 [Tagetes erecta]|uniref:Uncharacterized protein n=1 Tax=Tagetes erecta TaxID=13708 RepID=A0AAD8JU52_TARER|nr:hypothetical protein QVD17_37385 [Tagetes erecta]
MYEARVVERQWCLMAVLTGSLAVAMFFRSGYQGCCCVSFGCPTNSHIKLQSSTATYVYLNPLSLEKHLLLDLYRNGRDTILAPDDDVPEESTVALTEMMTKHAEHINHTLIIHHDSSTTSLKNKLIVFFGEKEGFPTKIDAHHLTDIPNWSLAIRDPWYWCIHSVCLIFQVYTQQFQVLSAVDRYGVEDLRPKMYHSLMEHSAPIPKGYGILAFPHLPCTLV